MCIHDIHHTSQINTSDLTIRSYRKYPVASIGGFTPCTPTPTSGEKNVRKRSVCQWFKDGLAEIGSNHSDYRTGLGLTVGNSRWDQTRAPADLGVFSWGSKRQALPGFHLEKNERFKFQYIDICNIINATHATQRYVVSIWQKSRDQNTSWAIWLLTNCLLF